MTTEMTTIDHSARAHSSVGGSSAKRVMECPGSMLLCEKYPSKSSEYAEAGTAMHEALDMILQGKTDKDSDVVGLTFNGIVIDQEMYEEGIAEALRIFDELDRELGGIEFLNEQRVVFPGIDGAFGTVDIVGSTKDRTVLIDWKMGAGVGVDAEANAQLLYYAYAAANTPATAKFFSKDKPIEMFIIQPRIRDGEPFTRWMTSYLQLSAFAIDLKHAVDKALEPDAPFKLGPHCRFCSGKIGCPLYNGLATKTLALTPEELAAQLAERLPYADAMIELGKSMKDMAHGLLEQGQPVKGWKLVNGRAMRSWVDEEKVTRYFAKVGLPAADRFVKKLISPAQAEKALKAASLPSELPAALVKKESSGTTLAKDSDPRPAVLLAGDALKALADRLAAR
jgi:hypothetical protein